MEMSNTGLSAGDIMALTKDNDGFGGVGLIILLFIFLMKHNLKKEEIFFFKDYLQFNWDNIILQGNLYIEK